MAKVLALVPIPGEKMAHEGIKMNELNHPCIGTTIDSVFVVCIINGAHMCIVL